MSVTPNAYQSRLETLYVSLKMYKLLDDWSDYCVVFWTTLCTAYVIMNPVWHGMYGWLTDRFLCPYILQDVQKFVKAVEVIQVYAQHALPDIFWADRHVYVCRMNIYVWYILQSLPCISVMVTNDVSKMVHPICFSDSSSYWTIWMRGLVG